MIFVTVGGELPFDRLIRAMDAWAAANPETEILAQIGKGSFEPTRMRWVRKLSRADYAATMTGAEIVVAHAGVGSVVSAGELGKAIVVLPRLARLGEHRNDHQSDTVTLFALRPGVHVAEDETRLAERIAAARIEAPSISAKLSKVAPAPFLDRLRGFVLD